MPSRLLPNQLCCPRCYSSGHALCTALARNWSLLLPPPPITHPNPQIYPSTPHPPTHSPPLSADRAPPHPAPAVQEHHAVGRSGGADARLRAGRALHHPPLCHARAQRAQHLHEAAALGVAHRGGGEGQGAGPGAASLLPSKHIMRPIAQPLYVVLWRRLSDDGALRGVQACCVSPAAGAVSGAMKLQAWLIRACPARSAASLQTPNSIKLGSQLIIQWYPGKKETYEDLDEVGRARAGCGQALPWRGRSRPGL